MNSGKIDKKVQIQPEAADGASAPFWRAKRLDEMSHAEWESLCDGCARCCLVKLEDEDDGSIHYTDLGCRLLEAGTCRCVDYKNRSARVPDCVTLTPDEVGSLNWLPPTCAYRLVADGRDLPWWHPLVSGRPETVHEAGISVKGKVFASEDDLPVHRWVERIKSWPKGWPKGSKGTGSKGGQVKGRP